MPLNDEDPETEPGPLDRLFGPATSAWRANGGADEQGSHGERLLLSMRDNPRYRAFFDVLADEAAFDVWMNAAPAGELQLYVVATMSLAYQYKKDRDLIQARYWAGLELRLAHALPAEYGPRQSPIGQGRSALIAGALLTKAKLLELEGALAQVHDLLLEAERHLDDEDRMRAQQNVTGRSLVERLLEAGDLRKDLNERLAFSAGTLRNKEALNRYANRIVEDEAEVAGPGTEIHKLVQRGQFELHRRRPNEALAYFQRAVDIANTETLPQRTSASYEVSHACRAMGDAYRALGMPRLALSWMERALALIDQSGSAERLSGIHLGIARVLRDAPGLGDPIEHFLRALEYCSVPAAPGEPSTWTAPDGRPMRIAAVDGAWPVLLSLSRHLEALGRHRKASEFWRLAADIAEKVRDGAFDETSRIAVQEEFFQVFTAIARTQLQAAADGPEDRQALEDSAWDAAEALRARSFLDAFGDGQMRLPAEVPGNLAVEEAALLERRRSLRSSPERGAAFWAEYQSVEANLKAVWRSIADVSPAASDYVAVREARPASLPAVAAAIGGVPELGASPGHRRAVVVNLLFLDDDRLAFLAVGGQEAHARALTAPVDRIRLTKFVKANFGTGDLVRELAVDLEDLFHHEMAGVVAPLADLCEPGDVLILCPAGPLHQVPLGAARLGNGILLERNPLAVSPNASLLRSRRGNRQAGGTRSSFAVFGDPTDDLPGARREATELADLWNVLPKLGAEANADAFLQALRTANTVHMAAHATFASTNPLASSVHLADRSLSAQEVLLTRAPELDLVTLSACETGVYHTGNSEDPMGFARALLFAGAGSLLSSLWKVPDAETRKLMTGFYTELERGALKAEALQRAALAVRADDPRIDRWAGFTLIGGWE